MTKKNDPLLIGVRFCGGCNPRFDRLKLFRQLEAGLAGAQTDGVGADAMTAAGSGRGKTAGCDSADAAPRAALVFWEEDLACDLHLFINGCPSECLLSEAPAAPVLLLNNTNKDNALTLLTDFIKQHEKGV